MSEKPEYNDKIIEAYLLAPAVFMTHAPHPIFILTSLAEDIEAIFHWLGARIIELEDCYRDFFLNVYALILIVFMIFFPQSFSFCFLRAACIFSSSYIKKLHWHFWYI